MDRKCYVALPHCHLRLYDRGNNVLRTTAALSSSVTRACDPSGGTKVMERGLRQLGRFFRWRVAGLPSPSWELTHMAWVKAQAL